MLIGLRLFDIYICFDSQGSQKTCTFWIPSRLSNSDPHVQVSCCFIVMCLKLISLFGKYYGGLEVLGFLKIHEGIADDDHLVAYLYFSGCCPIETNTP